MCMYTRVVGTKIVVSVYFCVFLSFQIVRKTTIESSIAAAICRIDGVRLKYLVTERCHRIFSAFFFAVWKSSRVTP